MTGSGQFRTSRHRYTSGKLKKQLPMKKPRLSTSRNDLNAQSKMCTKAVMKVKYEYRVAIQEARVTRCNELEESEAAYLEALSENVAAKSLQCATADCSEHARHMHELERWALDAENKMPPGFPPHTSSCPMACFTISQGESTFLLPYLIRAVIIIFLVYSVCQGTPDRVGNHL